VIDLHTHSTYSDGTFTPEEIIKTASEKNIRAIALTDHDTIDGLKEICFYGSKYDIEVIKGIEIATNYNDTEIHIVGLFIDDENEELKNKLFELKQNRLDRNIKMVKKLNSLSIPITYEEVEEESNKKIITRAHFAKVLVKKGIVNSIKESFNKYLDSGKPAYVKRKVLEPKQAIQLIKNSGGVAVLAHPLLYNLGNEKLNEMIEQMYNFGLRAIECYYPSHKEEDFKYLKEIANKYGLKYSGGSDFHGLNKPNISLGTGYGNLKIPYKVLEELKKIK